MIEAGDHISYTFPNAGLEADFNAAVKFVGETWLQNKRSEFGVESIANRNEEIPEIVRWYAAAQRTHPSHIDPKDLRGLTGERALKFYQLGSYLSLLGDVEVIHRSGEQSEKSLSKLYQTEIRSANENLEDLVYELITGGWYRRAGHEIAFIDESASTKKTPEFRITDTDPVVDIECRHARPNSRAKRKWRERVDDFQKALYQTINQPYIAYLQAKKDIPETVFNTYLRDIENLNNLTEYISIQNSQTELHLLPIPEYFPFTIHPNVLREFGVEECIKRLVVLDAVEDQSKFEFSENVNEWINFLSHRDNPGRIGGCGWLFVDSVFNEGEKLIDRINRKLSGTSGKFEKDRPGVVHLEIPELEGMGARSRDTLNQELSGELVQRSNISALVITSQDYFATGEAGRVKVTHTALPHYELSNQLPQSFSPFGMDLEEFVERYQLIDRILDHKSHRYIDIKEWMDNNEPGLFEFRTEPGVMFGDERSCILSESNQRALLVGGSSDSWGQLDLIGSEIGIYTVQIPPRLNTLEEILLGLYYDGEKFLASCKPVLNESKIDSSMVSCIEPVIPPRELTESKTQSIANSCKFTF